MPKSCMKIFSTVLLGLAACAASAQDYPNRPLTLVVPFTAGATADNTARVVAKALADVLGQPVIVDNRSGAGGNIGTEYVAQSKPDGYTLLFGPSGPLSTNPYLYKNVRFDPVKSFKPVHTLVESSMLMVVNTSSRFRSVAEFTDYAKRNPGQLNFGSAGAGTSTHLVGELLQQEAGFRMSHIPYKGTSPELVDLLAGRLDASFDHPAALKPFVDSGKLRALAVTGAVRRKMYPDLPTLKELGYPGAVLTAWSMIFAPAGTSQPVIDKLSTALDSALQKAEVLAHFEENGLAPMPPMTGEQMRRFIESENAKFKTLVERTGLKAE